AMGADPPRSSPRPSAGELATGTRAPVAGGSAGRTGDEIAIVGLSCRFPGSDDLDQFWADLVAGRDCITEIPAERWDFRQDFDPEPGKRGKTYSKWGGFIRDIDRFDGEFFRISPREAERMDPQERLFLQEVWHAMEDGGLTTDALSPYQVGVYVGVMYSQYQLLEAEELLSGNPIYLGSSYATIANRVSYTFNFRGPSMALDSMCSSSLTAVHLACEALRRGDIDVAVTGGVNLSLHPNKYIDLSQGRYAATDGRCRSFGAGGSGYVPGEGIGVAILKPLAAATEAGDRIHAVIRGSALGHGGKTNGYSVPNPAEQSRLIEEAIRRADVDPRRIGYVEAHGTGTRLGDPIEVTALSRALGQRAPGDGPCALGSVKSNIGHLESAAGIAGLIKVVLQLRHRQLVPSLHADVLNPHINFDSTSLRVQRSLSTWNPPFGGDGEAPAARVAGVSSFGAGGANAYLIVEEYPVPAALSDTGPDAPPHLIVLSAASGQSLRALARQVARYVADRGIDRGSDHSWLADVAYTLRCGRQSLDERLAVLADGCADLVERLREFADHRGAGKVLHGGAGDPGHPSASAAQVADLVSRRDLEALAQVWVRGTPIRWTDLDPTPRRKLGLPGYPFARERHWPELTSRAKEGPTGESHPLHPLLGRNVSTLEQQRFVTTFTGSAPLLRDHVVTGRPLLPAAAILEMVRAAAAHSALGDHPRVEDTVFEA
ncbi:MAG: type I polyketide synthase, partial [Stackebrandtia sp.]